VAHDRLKGVKHTVEIDRKHLPPVVIGPVDESIAATTTNPSIGETAVDTSELLKRRLRDMFGLLTDGDIANLRTHSAARFRD
jgi:hypothetical protein